jgi:inorganic triphosphatase YgiF
MPIERELKFRIEAGAAARAARLLPFASRQRLRRIASVYYDTPDFRLEAAGAALRLRRDGRGSLQTLKAPQGVQTALAARHEWEMRAPRGRLAPSLFPREAVRAATGLDIVRLAPRLRPVFTTRFERRSALLALGHGVRAEACIDRGAIEAARSREAILELELELIEGDIGPLLGLAETLVEPLGLRIENASKAERGYRLFRSAAPPPPAKWLRPAIAEHAAASDAFVILCSAALAQIAANADGVARGDDPEYLHQLRVGVRRLRSAVRAFRPLLKRRRARAVEQPLRQMMRTFGAARDWDVFCQALAEAQTPAPLLRVARRRRAAARRAARGVVSSARFQLAQLGALRWLHGDPWRSDSARAEPLPRFARRSLERLHARLLQRARKIDWRDVPRRHAVRIAVKRLRYACDFFAPCFPHQAVAPMVRALAALQDTLGELNDLAVARGLLAELAAPHAAPELRAAASQVRAGLAARERQLIASVAQEWAALARGRPYWRPKPRRRARR